MPPDTTTDALFGAFIAGFDPGRLQGFELDLYRYWRYQRLLAEEHEEAAA